MEMDIGDMIQFHRKKSGLTQIELAQMAEVGKTVIYDIEKGKKTIRLDTLLKVLKVLNIKINFDAPFHKEFKRQKLTETK